MGDYSQRTSNIGDKVLADNSTPMTPMELSFIKTNQYSRPGTRGEQHQRPGTRGESLTNESGLGRYHQGPVPYS